jgi:hypothetical protein
VQKSQKTVKKTKVTGLEAIKMIIGSGREKKLKQKNSIWGVIIPIKKEVMLLLQGS